MAEVVGPLVEVLGYGRASRRKTTVVIAMPPPIADRNNACLLTKLVMLIRLLGSL